MFVAVFVVNLIGILIVSLLILPAGFNEQVADMKQQANATVDGIIEQLQYSDDFYTSVDENRISHGMLIYIENIDGNIVYTYPDESAPDRINKDSSLYITASEKFLSTNSNGQQVYFIKAAIALNSKFSLVDMPPFLNIYLSKILIFEIIVFTISMIIVLIYIRRTILFRLEGLANSIHGYNKKIQIRKSDDKDELKSLTKDFNALKSTLTEEEKKQTRIIASISHDIKTPLTSIMGYAEQLKKDELSVERKNRYVNTIYEKSLAIKKMIEGLDDYLSYNVRADSSEKNNMSVKQLLSVVDSYYRDDLERENCVFTINDKCGEAVISVNRADMIRVFGNVISNSIKHRTENQLKIAIDACVLGDNVVFRMSDNGKGVEEWQLKKIFEPLYTTDDSRSKSVSGLGLSISKDIIEAHYGRIHAEKSEFESGLTIVFSIPVIKK